MATLATKQEEGDTDMIKDLDYYLGLPWSYSFEWDPRDNHYVASVKEISGCKSCGDTIDEAASMIREALELCIETLLEFGDPITEPVQVKDFKGIITYRTTPEKHFKLAQKASTKGKSINKLIDELIDKEIA